MHITYDLPVAIDDIIEAKQRLAGRIYKTGMPRSNYFSERCKGEIFLKFENMQRTGSFKIRGAFNKLSSLTDAEKRKGVVACSAGNHAQGVSLSCAMLRTCQAERSAKGRSAAERMPMRRACRKRMGEREWRSASPFSMTDGRAPRFRPRPRRPSDALLRASC